MGIMAPPGPVLHWAGPSPEAAGIRTDTAERLALAAARGDCPGLHTLVLARNGRLALECRFPGTDQRFGQTLGLIEHQPGQLHDVRSVTKSIVSLLYGIALAEGLAPPVSARLFDQYPNHLDDPRKRRITIAHVLSMRMGLEWSEGLDYDNPGNDEIRMESAPDRIAYVLSRKIAGPPGRTWSYCGGSTALLGDLIAKGSGMDLADYARTRLFEPMGIEQFEWMRGNDGVPVSSSGLRLEPRDLARIGQLILDKGLWNGRRVVPPGWLASSFKPRAFVEAGLRYGYQWWLGSLAASGKPWQATFGNGGQRLIIAPSLKLVVVILAGNYNAPDQWKMPARLMQRVVIPALIP